MTERPLYVIHIRSFGHSGSTLLNILLDRCDQVFAGAELFRYARLLTRVDTQETADGTPVCQSKFWNAVKLRLREQGEEAAIISAGDEVNESHVINFLKALSATYGASVIVDTSKSSHYGDILYRGADAALIVHLVRDGRAIVNSLQCTGLDRLRTPLLWTFSNLRTLWRFHRRANYHQIRYEDVVFSTDKCINEILVGASQQFNIALTTDNLFDSAGNSFAGNRMRSGFDGKVRYDDTYLTRISGPYWAYLTILMLPALLLFRLPLTRSGVRKRAKDLAEIQYESMQ